MNASLHVQKGFIALISAIVIATLLVTLAASIGASTFFTRFDVLNSEYKRISLGLAEACANSALAKIGTDFNYLVTTDPAYSAIRGGAVVPLGTAYGTTTDCVILSPTTTPSEVGGKRIFPIKTKASFFGAWSDMSISATAQDPGVAPVIPPPSCTLIASPSSVPLGQAITLLWSASSNATGMTLDHGIGAVTPVSAGSVNPVYPSGVGVVTYTGSASNAGGTNTCTVDVTVTAPPPSPGCADTVAIFDRTGSMAGSDLNNEKSAGTALVNLYASVAPAPKVGVGSFGAYPNAALPGGAAAIPTAGQLSSAFSTLLSTLSSMLGSNSSVGSNLGAAISVAQTELDSLRHDPNKPKVLVFISDGVPNEPSSTLGNTATSSPTSSGTDAGSGWTNPQNAYASGGADASDTNGDRERYYNFNFPTIPTGSSISGISAVADAWSTVATTSSQITLAPNALGNYDQWSVSSGGNNANNRLSAVASASGTFLVAGANGSAETVSVPTSGIPAGAVITSITLTALAAEQGGTASVALRVENGTGAGHQSDDAPHTLTSGAFTTLTRTLPTNPLTGTAWTISTLGSARFGVVRTNASGGTPRVDQVSVSVTYSSVPANSGCELGMDLSWNGGASWTSEKDGTLTGSLTSLPFGSASDDWTGHTWAPGDFSNTNFRARVRDVDPGGSCADTATTHLDWLRLQVSYSAPADPTQFALTAATAAKNDGISLFAIHFGDTSGQTLMSQLASPSALSSVSISAISRSGGTVTVTTSAPHHFAQNERVQIAGVANGTYNGSVTIVSTATANSFTYSQSGTSGSSSGGTAAPTNLFIAPSSSAMSGIFSAIGLQVCPAAAPACSNTIDDDGDGLIDEADPGCHTDGSPNNAASYNANDNDEWETGTTPSPPPPPPPPPNITIGAWQEVP